jgi:hypothetical protein
MSYWVHREVGGRRCDRHTRPEPPLQPVVAGRGFPHFHVEYRDFVFRFASLAEVRVCIDTLGRKLLPTTLRLTQERGGQVGPNSHWLSRLPSRVLSWRYREPAVVYLRKALAAFEQEVRVPTDT